MNVSSTNPVSPDFFLSNRGASVVILNARSNDARQWVNRHLPTDRMKWGRDGTAVEARFIDDIVVGIQEDGLTVA